MSNKPNLLDLVNQVPLEPGCYLWKDKNDKVLYVGKAKNLRNRMKQYVLGEDERVKIPMMMEEVEGFDYIVVGSEHEALVLEINLIQQYKPYYNVDLKDDKSYPYIAITKGDIYPAIKYTRERHRSDTRYFGPFTDSRAARQTIDIVRKICPICTCRCNEWKKSKKFLEKNPDENAQMLLNAQDMRPCFDFHVGRGPGVCAGVISPEEYKKNIEQVERFLSGHRSEFVEIIKEEMQQAASELDFERAARCKKRLDTISALDTKQKVVFPSAIDMDVIGFWREETIAGAYIFLVREGRVIRTVDYVLNKGMDVPQQDLVESFVKRYYKQTDDIPLEVDLPIELEDAEVIEEWLSGMRGRKVVLHTPQRGNKHKLLEMANQNARHTLARYELKTGYEDKRTNEALLQLESALALPNPPMRIECFDISTIHGKHTVASMVVFTAGAPDKSQYRRFKIRTELDEANDVVSMAEVMDRRYCKEKMADTRFGSKPDLLILDGGKPQLNAAAKQLKELGVDIPMAGLAKSDEELFVLWDDYPVVLPSGSASLYLVKRVRDEAHRFAITYHRELRAKAMTVSILDEIPGVGPARKKAITKRFPSMKKLREASLDEIKATDGIPEDVAKDIWETLRAWEEQLAETRKDADII